MLRQVGAYRCVIPFYEANEIYGWLANTFRGKPVTVDGEEWPTTEHYFQAQKYPGNTQAEIQYRRRIKEYNGSFRDFPKFAKETAGSIPDLPAFDTNSWDGSPLNLDGRSHTVMRKALRKKIEQHKDLETQFDALPNDVIIVEATKNDKKWGDGDDGSGANNLGILWKELLLERKGLAPDAAKKRAHDEYQQFNKIRQGKSLYTYSQAVVPSPQGQQSSEPSSSMLAGQSHSLFSASAPSANTSAAPKFTSAPAAELNIWFDTTRNHKVVERYRNADLQLHFKPDGSFKRVLYRLDSNASWQEGDINHPNAQRLYRDYQQQLTAGSYKPGSVPPTTSAPSAPAQLNIWFDKTRNHQVVERYRNADLQLHFEPDGRFKRVLYRLNSTANWQVGDINHPNAQRLYQDYQQQLAAARKSNTPLKRS